MQNYSSTIASLIVLALAWFPSNLKDIFTEGEVVQVVEFIVGAVTIVYLWIKRYKQGGITPLGVRK